MGNSKSRERNTIILVSRTPMGRAEAADVQRRSQSMIITSARITALPQELGDPMPEVWVKFQDFGQEGAPETEEEKLFEYYPDEISFTPKDFIGLTRQEAISLKTQKDKKYLRDEP